MQNLTIGQRNNNNLMSTKSGHIYKRFHARKHHAKKYNIPFNLTLEYIESIAPDCCPIFDTPLSWCVQGQSHSDNSPTIDRIIPELGYIVGNVIWLSNRANRIKNGGTMSEHKAIYEFMLKHSAVR